MEKFVLFLVIMIFLATATVSAQKGRSFVNRTRSPVYKMKSIQSQSSIGQAEQLQPQRLNPKPISQMHLESSNILSINQTESTNAAPISLLVEPIAQVPKAAIAASVRGEEENSYPAPEPYSFSFSVNDEESGTQLAREESQDAEGNVVGFYQLFDGEGRSRRVNYVAGPDGFKAVVNSNEEGLRNSNAADADFIVEEVPLERQNAAAAAAQAAYKNTRYLLSSSSAASAPSPSSS